MSNGGYQAGSIYVDLIVRTTDTTKKIDELSKKIQQLEKKEKTYLSQKKVLQKTLEQERKLFGANSKQVQATERKIQSLAAKERLLSNELKLVNKALQNQANNVNNQSKAFNSLITSANKAANTFRNLKSRISSSYSGIAGLTTSLNTLKVAILGVAAHRLYDALIIPGAEIEQTVTSLNVLLGSYEKAQKLTDNLVELAAKTPLVTSDLTQGAKQLLAANVALEDIEGTLEMLGDVAMGSSETFESLVSAYAKIQTSGRAQLRNIYSFTTAGVPLIDALVDSLNVSTEEFYKLSRAGQITSKDVEKALTSLTEEGGRFADMMDRQSKTYTGLLSTVKDNFEILSQKIGKEALEQLKESLTSVLEEIERLEKTGELEVIIKQWGGAFADLIKGIGSAVSFLYEFRDIVSSVITAFVGYKAISFTAGAITNLAKAATSAAGPLSALAISLATLYNSQKKVIAELDLGYNSLIKSNEELRGSFNYKIEELDIQRKQAEELSNSLTELTSKEKLNTAEKEELYGVIQELNDIYPNLNLQLDEESNKLNRNIGDINAYIEAMSNRSNAQLYIDLAENLKPQIIETETAISLISKQIENIEKNAENLTNKTLGDALGKFLDGDNLWAEGLLAQDIIGDFKEFGDIIKNEVITYQVAEEAIEDLRQSRESLVEQLSDMESKQKSYIESAYALNKTNSESSQTIQALEDSWESADKTINDVKEDIKALVDALKESKEEFKGSFDVLINELDEFTDVLSQEGDTLKLTEKQALDLVKTYPKLVDKIQITSDAFTVERTVIEELKASIIDQAKTTIELQKTMTEEAIEATKNRILTYNKEISSIINLVEAQKNLEMAQKNLDKFKSDAKKDKKTYLNYTVDEILGFETAVEDAKELVNLYSLLEDMEKSGEAYAKEMEIILANLEDSAKESTKGETKEEAAIRNLKYSLDMQLITQEEYYNSLEKMKDAYYAKGTKQWQQYTLEIYKGRKQLEEENAQAEVKAFEDRLKNSYSWIEDEQFYGRIDNDGLIAAYERMKAYTKEYYDSGKIDYEKYADTIKKLDKEIYAAMKDNLSTSNKDLSDLRKKRYDEAVKQVEDYYDALERAEEEAERQKQLSELQGQLELYKGAVTRAGQEKYAEIAEDIEDIKKEGEKAAREVEKQSKLEELERTYNSLEETQNAYFESVLTYSDDVTKRIQEMTALVNSAFANVNNIISGVSEGVNNNNSYQTIINQNNNINSEAAGRAVVNMTDILYRYNV